MEAGAGAGSVAKDGLGPWANTDVGNLTAAAATAAGAASAAFVGLLTLWAEVVASCRASLQEGAPAAQPDGTSTVPLSKGRGSSRSTCSPAGGVCASPPTLDAPKSVPNAAEGVHGVSDCAGPAPKPPGEGRLPPLGVLCVRRLLRVGACLERLRLVPEGRKAGSAVAG